MVSDWSAEEKATSEILKYAVKIKSEVEEELRRSFGDFIAKRFIYKVDDKNIHYIIKIQGGADQWIHAYVLQDMPCFDGNLKLKNLQYPKNEADPVTPF